MASLLARAGRRAARNCPLFLPADLRGGRPAHVYRRWAM